MKKRMAAGITAFMIASAALAGCKNEDVTVTVFAAKSLNSVLDELTGLYCEENPGVVFETNYDSSGTLMTQIIEGGASCDVFFSADEKQMDQLEKEGFVVDGTRENIVNNQVCVVTYKGSGTKVTGLEDLDKAQSLAIADGSVPVGKYTRQALVNAGILPETEDVSKITSEEISEAFGGVSINECSNVGAVASSIAEHSNEVGTVYYSDTFGYEEALEIIEIIPYDLTGNVIYPAAQIKNDTANDARNEAAADFISFLTSDEAKEVFEAYNFDVSEVD